MIHKVIQDSWKLSKADGVCLQKWKLEYKSGYPCQVPIWSVFWLLLWKQMKQTVAPIKSLNRASLNIQCEKQSATYIQTVHSKMLCKVIQLHKFILIGPLCWKQTLQKKNPNTNSDDISPDSQQIPHSTFIIPVLCLQWHFWSGPVFFKQFRVRNHDPPCAEWHIFGGESMSYLLAIMLRAESWELRATLPGLVEM